MEEMIKIENLTKRYGELTAVDHVSMQIHHGELFALLGVNGAGKTSMIKMLSCLIRPTEGGAKINGFSTLKDSQKIKQMLNVSPQETAIAPNLTVRENIELIAQLYGLTKQQTETKTNEMLEQFHLKEVEKKPAKLLSGGMQRRLSIAMALVSEPKILFLDEPTLGLDVLARRELWKVIQKLKGNITMVLTTHYLEEAEALADRIGIMSRGKLIACDSLSGILNLSGEKNLEDAFIKLSEEEAI